MTVEVKEGRTRIETERGRKKRKDRVRERNKKKIRTKVLREGGKKGGSGSERNKIL